MYSIDSMSAADAAAYEDILDICFGPGRKAKISYRFRDNVPASSEFCMSAHADGEGLIGAIQYWPCRVNNLRAELLGPIAVLPHWRGRGVARALVHQSMARVAEAGVDIVVLVGDPALYRQYGFYPASAQSMVIANEDPTRVQIHPFTAAGEMAWGPVTPLVPASAVA